MHKIYTGSVNLTNNTYENCQTITQVDLMQTPWINNSMSYAFNNCSNLQTVTNINSKVNDLTGAFNNCKLLVNAPVLPPTASDLFQTFRNCTNLVNVPAIPQNALSMAATFMDCSNIISAPTIPNSVINLTGTFEGCTRLTTIPSLENVEDSVPSSTFKYCLNLIDQPILPKIAYDLTQTFFGCSKLTSINLPQNTINLPETYYGCSNLTSVPNISVNVSNMYHTFGACTNISGDINILSDKIVNVTNIFGETSLRKNVYIPPVCYNDTSVNSPTYNSFIAAGYDNIGTKDGVYLMYNYSPALPSDWITSTATNNAIVLEKYIGTNTTVITPHNDWYSNKVLNVSNYSTGPFVKSTVIKNVDLVEVEVINNDFSNAFHQCYNLIEVSNLNQNITNLANTFSECTNLYQVPSIPPNVTNLYGTYQTCWNINTPPTIPTNVIDMNSTFQACMRLTNIPTIPDSVTNTNLTFGWCTSLTDVNFIANNTINTRQTFAQCTGLQSANATAPNSINASYMFDGCNSLTNLNIVIPNATDITGIFRNCNNLTNVYAEFNSISNLSNFFDGYNTLQSVNIVAQNATDISNLFNQCSNLTSIELNCPNATNLYGTFNGCANLAISPVLPPNTTNLRQTFRGCHSLTDFPIIPTSVTGMYDTFAYCWSVTDPPILPPNITQISGCFQCCYNLTTPPVIPDNVGAIDYAFHLCKNLATTPEIPNNVYVGTSAFYYCQNLTTLPNIGTNMQYMYQMFRDCVNVTGNMYIQSNKIVNVTDCFQNTYLTKNIFIPFEYENGVNTITRNSFEAAYPINTPNGTIAGTLNNDNGVISGFSNTSYMTLTKPSAITNDQWEVQIKFTPTEILSSDWVGIFTGLQFDCFNLHISSGKIKNEFSSDGTTWNIGSIIGATLTANTTYWVRTGWKDNTYYLDLSTDGSNWTSQGTISSSTKIQTLSTEFYIGTHHDTRSAATTEWRYFRGTIDLKECYIKINGQNVWNGYVRPNGVVLKDIDGSRIAINPTPADATVLMFNETTGTEVDEEVLNKFSYISIDGNVEIQALNTTDTEIIVPSQWIKTNRMRAPEGSIIHYRVYKDGYYPVESQIIVDGSQDINVNLEQIMCTFTIVPMPTDATVTLTTDDISYWHLYCWGSETEGYHYIEWPDIASIPEHVGLFTIYNEDGTQDLGYDSFHTDPGIENGIEWVTFEGVGDNTGKCYRTPERDVTITIPKYPQSGNSITVPWGTEVSYTVSKTHYTTVTGTEIVKTTGSRYVPLAIDKHTFTINPTPADAAVQILVNGRLVNASNSDWVFTANNANGDIELQEYIGSNTVVVMPTSYETTNTVTADYGSTIEWTVSRKGYHPKTGTLTLEQDTTLDIELAEITYGVDVSDYNYTLNNKVVTLTQYVGEGGDIDTPEIEEI